ncbi:restriction endonuclease [Candidatus Peregrinibacteria bacterium CG10_big_fil_rev_8_21_14_0_10_36_19]|nr:MAG: restriction endonuclease [Candidatus Peregrinibacteria bacterium CG10_big_fil_rev_8_21_14_0_10_36_19]
MKLDLQNKEWKEFEIGVEFLVKNSKAYHKTELKESKARGLAYVSRTNNNNGIESIVVEDKNFKINPPNTIVFGAENATFFYQSGKYITGNKMYYIQNKLLTKQSGLFVQMMLNQSIKNCGFGYGKGLTGTRVINRIVNLPIDSRGNPDYAFMEAYMKQKEQGKLDEYRQFVKKRLPELQGYKEVEALENKEWNEFEIEDVAEIESGRDIYEKERISGNIPYVSATANNNGIGYFVGNDNNTKELGCLSVNRNGSVGYSFYHPYSALFSNDCRKLRLKSPSKHVGIFISQQITRQRGKYGYGYKMGTARLKKQKIMLPVNQANEPDYKYMENYIKRLEYQKLSKYLSLK